MEIEQPGREYLKVLSEKTLSKLEIIAELARTALGHKSIPGSKSLAYFNTATDTLAIERMAEVNKENRENYLTLAREPAIARVVVTLETGEQRTYYFCRATAISGVGYLAGYHAPIGRLASLPIGSEFRLPNGDIVEVQERALLQPSKTEQEWDSRNTIIEGDLFGPVTIKSLQALLKKASVVEEKEDIVAQILNKRLEADNILKGIRRNVITKMELRDQPILDQYQDEIFRMPLDTNLLILGPPGTGKTTTLIRRLGQKLDTAYLDEDEQNIIESSTDSSETEHDQSWLMFTPTILLKQYLKEAFAREGVPASDFRIQTWSDHRRNLSRNTFRVLKTATGRGSFVLKENVETVVSESIEKSIDWFTDFNDWQQTTFIENLSQSAKILNEQDSLELAKLGQRLLSIIERANSRSLSSTFSALAVETENVRELLASMKKETDDKIKNALNIQLHQSKTFIDELLTFINDLQVDEEAQNEELDELDEDEEEEKVHRVDRAAAISAYMQTVRTQARTIVRKKNIGKNTRAGKIVEWLGQRTLEETELAEVGRSLLVQSSARQFVNPVKRYFDSIPIRYRAFRRLRQKENRWYHSDGFNSSDIHPLELDVVLLVMLRGANELLSMPSIVRNIESRTWSALEPFLNLYKNQILIDEITDFSPVQIACMGALSNPHINSFFACGDFNQRLTTWGTRSIDEIKWVFPVIETKEITVSYRQSRQLHELARAIILAAGGTEPNVTLPAHIDSEGVAPVLLETESDIQNIANWLAERIREIERFVNQVPSTAIFVNSEDEVQPITEALNFALSEHNIQVVACSQGRIMGQDNDVRVFDVQHIKGLEFEAVFFIGIDRLASLYPQLFDKYLYVGTTRAATYLGVTCYNELPDTISSLREMFVADWETPRLN